MTIQILMPALSPTMDKGKLVKWLVREGQHVSCGDAIAEIETDKAAAIVEAVDEGKIARILVSDGTDGVKINTPIALLDAGRSKTKVGRFHLLSRMLRRVNPAALSQLDQRSQVERNPSPRVDPDRPTRIIDRRLPAAATKARQSMTRQEGATELIAGWLVIIKGPGRGRYRPVYAGTNSVGRDATQRICLNFGDSSIAREDHAYIVYDEAKREFCLRYGGKQGLGRWAHSLLVRPTKLKRHDQIRIGKTTLRFIPCCGPQFTWADEIKDATG